MEHAMEEFLLYEGGMQKLFRIDENDSAEKPHLLLLLFCMAAISPFRCLRFGAKSHAVSESILEISTRMDSGS
jgi:hypothetical protein